MAPTHHGRWWAFLPDVPNPCPNRVPYLPPTQYTNGISSCSPQLNGITALSSPLQFNFPPFASIKYTFELKHFSRFKSFTKCLLKPRLLWIIQTAEKLEKRYSRLREQDGQGSWVREYLYTLGTLRENQRTSVSVSQGESIWNNGEGLGGTRPHRTD